MWKLTMLVQMNIESPWWCFQRQHCCEGIQEYRRYHALLNPRRSPLSIHLDKGLAIRQLHKMSPGSLSAVSSNLARVKFVIAKVPVLVMELLSALRSASIVPPIQGRFPWFNVCTMNPRCQPLSYKNVPQLTLNPVAPQQLKTPPAQLQQSQPSV